MSKYSYKGMIVTADSKDKVKVLSGLARNYLNVLEIFLGKFGLGNDGEHIAEKDNETVIVDSFYSVENSQGIKLKIVVNMMLRHKNDEVIMKNSTIDYKVSIGSQEIVSNSLNGSQLEPKNLKDAMTNVVLLAKCFSET